MRGLLICFSGLWAALVPAEAQDIPQSLDFAGCTHFVTIHDRSCEVHHVYTCQGRGPVQGGTRSFREDRLFYEVLTNDRGYMVEDLQFFDDGTRHHARLRPDSVTFETRPRGDGGTTEETRRSYDLLVPGGALDLREYARTEVFPFGEEVLQFSAKPYTHITGTTVSSDGFPVQRFSTRTEGHLVEGKQPLYLHKSYSFRYEGEEEVVQDVSPVAVLAPGEEGFDARTSILACGQVS